MDTRPGPTARRMRDDERGVVLDSVVAAFARDPLVRWWLPDDDTYPALARRFFEVLLDLRVRGGEVWVAGGGAAVAMWNPPGGNLIGAQAAAEYAAVVGGLPEPAPSRIAAVDAGVEALLPDEAHWYLGVLATAPDRQGEGLAAAVLAPVLGAAARAGLPVLLETGLADNLTYYARHGFTVVGAIDVPGCPDSWVLRRDPLQE